MTEKLSFSEYCKSKDSLRLAAEDVPKLTVEYEFTKYCKLPTKGGEEDEGQYVSFRPKDTISVLWEYLNPDQPVPRNVVVKTDDEDEEKIHPAWSNSKLSSWLSKNTRKAQ